MSVVDWDVALESTAGDPELLNDIIDTFLEEWVSMLQSIRVAVEQEDAPQLNIAAHTLKSGLRIFGCGQGADLAFALEQLGDAGSFEGTKELLAQLEPNVAEVVAALKEHRGIS